MVESLKALVCVQIDYVEFQVGFKEGFPFFFLDVEVYLEEVVLLWR